ncbi:unnamed protein product, partial [Ectocarpus sp. 12 AP-2014]
LLGCGWGSSRRCTVFTKLIRGGLWWRVDTDDEPRVEQVKEDATAANEGLTIL